MVRLFLVSLLLSLTVDGFSQERRIDSLLHVLERTVDATHQVDLLNEIAFSCYDYDVRKGYDYASRAYTLARQNKYFVGKRYALTLKGFYFFDTGEYGEALALYKQAREIDYPDDEHLAYNLVLTANTYRVKASYDSAQSFYDQAISMLIKLEEERLLAYAYRNLGRLCLLQWKNELAESYFNKALDIYTKKGNRFGKAESYFSLSELHKNLANYQLAQKYVQDGCALAEALDDDYLKLNCLINQGEIKYRLGEFMEGLDHLLRAVDLLKRKDLPQSMAKVYSDLADIYEALGQNEMALRYYFESLKIAERLGLKYEIGKVNSNIAWIYKNQRNFSPAYEYMDKSLKQREQIRDEFGIANSYNVKGIIYYQQKDYLPAIEWIRKSLAIRERIGHKEGVSACLYNLGLIYEERKDFREALKYQFKALKIEETTGNRFNIAIANSSIGSLYTHLHKFDSAKHYLQLADDLGHQTGSMDLQMENAFYWSEFYEYQGKEKEALKWHKKYSALNDSLYQENSATKLAEMHALYQTERKDKEITLLNQEKLLQSNQIQLQNARINLQNYFIIFIIVALVLVSLLAYNTYRYNKDVKVAHQEILHQKEELQAQSERLQEANLVISESNKLLEAKVEERTHALREAYKELDTFFYRASHDFRRPLTTFLGLVEVANITVKDQTAKELFDKVRETAVNLDKMLLKLQSISDLGSQQLEYEEVPLSELFEEVVRHFSEELEERKIRIVSSVILQNTFYSYPSMIYIILENLVENSIAFCRYENAYIRLSAYEEGDNVFIQVEDNGEGIEEKYHNRIFEMYFRGNDRSKGNGLGLYIIKKAVEKLNGTMRFKSGRDKGTIFTLSFPLGVAVAEQRVRITNTKDALVI